MPSIFAAMGKKKKRGGAKNDARGYATSTVAPKVVPQPQTKSPSEKNDEELTTDGSTQVAVASSTLSEEVTTTKRTDSPDDVVPKRFYKKIEILYSRLSTDVGFDDSKIKTIVSNVATQEKEPSLGAALDWACLHFETKDLPPILTEECLRDMRQQDVEVVAPSPQRATPAEGVPAAVGPKPVLAEPAKNEQQRTSPHIDGEVTEIEKESSQDNDSFRAWVLSQYQYCEENAGEVSDDKDGSGGNAPGGDGAGDRIAEESTKEKQDSPLLLPEEVELKKVNDQILKLETTLNDEPSNYMRSKAEIKDLQKELARLRKQASKWRAKVANALAATRQKEDEEGPADEMDLGGDGLFGIFDEKESLGNAGPSDSVTNTTEEKSTHNNKQKGSDDVFVLSSFEPAIPDTWTGRTPQYILEERCRKENLPKPSFSRFCVGGCAVKIRFSVRGRAEERSPLVLEQHGPFHSFNDAKQYLSTLALWELVGKNDDLPVYRLFPPVFGSLWKSWMRRQEEEKQTEEEASQVELDVKVQELIELLPKSMWLDRKTEENSNNSYTTIHEPSPLSNGNEAKERRDSRRNEMGEQLCRDFGDRRHNPEYREMAAIRAKLPMYAYRTELLDMIEKNPVSILCAETGAGKTTQCPQFLLEQALIEGNTSINIICTQPRRVAAMSVADRVAEEMCEPSGVGRLVGYQIRMESKHSSQTRLMFCTTGVVLRRLQDDPNLTGVTHVLVDEVHERQWQIDFLLITLRQLLQTTRPELKVILMSATLDTKLFGSFFENAPLLNVPGRTFAVQNYFLEDLLDATNYIIEADSRHAIRGESSTFQREALWVTTKGGEKRREVASLESQTDVSDVSGLYAGYKMATQRSMDRVDEKVINYDLIEDVLSLLVDDNNNSLVPPEGSATLKNKGGAILVFLPGLGEIRALADRLQGSRVFGNRRRFDVIPLHSALSPQDQKRPFRLPPAGCRKIILSTNIAETSVTISDVVAVIDCGLVREIRQDMRYATNKLVSDWCSRASAKQRSGRAGRVQEGVCCKLFSRLTFEEVMREQSMPELQRLPLEEVCLNILAGNLASNCAEFLQQAPQPPSQRSILLALELLEEVGALEVSDDGQEMLTPLGRHLAKLPVHVRLGKILIFGALFSCLDKALTISAGLSAKSPFSSAFGNEAQAKAYHRVFKHKLSDFFTLCNVWEAFQQNQGKDRGRRFCYQHYLNFSALVEISDSRKQFLELLSQLGFASGYHRHSNGDPNEWLRSTNLCMHSSNDHLVHAVVCAGLYPNVARIEHHVTDVPALWHKSQRLYFHSISTNYNRRLPKGDDWLVFNERFATSNRTSVSATAPVLPSALVLFGGDVEVQHMERSVVVDKWISLPMAAQTAVRFRAVRKRLDQVLSRRLGKKSLERDESEIINDIVHLHQDRADDVIQTLMGMDLVAK